MRGGYPEAMERIDVDKVRERLSAFKAKLGEAAELGRNDAMHEFAETVEKGVKKIVDREIAVFYADYTPRTGGYVRRESLYDIPDIELSGLKLKIEFNPEGTSFRSGYDGEDGLYDQVFRKGWHGGADSGPGHPPSETPYWRTPIPYYRYWGSAAKIAETPPLESIREALDEYRQEQLPELWVRTVTRCIKKRISELKRGG